MTWKPVGTFWVNCGLWIIFPPMYPPITFWVHLDYDLNMCPACTQQITFKMLPKMDTKYSCDMPSHTSCAVSLSSSCKSFFTKVEASCLTSNYKSGRESLIQMWLSSLLDPSQCLGSELHQMGIFSIWQVASLMGYGPTFLIRWIPDLGNCQIL